MPSGTLTEPRTNDHHAQVVQDLLVLWQHPVSREIIPIGRLAHHSEGYSFIYTKGAAGINHFRPLPGLPDLHRTYTSRRMPAIFGQRVMDSDRPDYAEYMNSLGLDPERATPWEQITNSGGARTGDTLQFMQVPFNAGGRACARFLTNGVRHVPGTSRNIGGRQSHVSATTHELALASIRPGDRLPLEAEVGNAHDEHATVVVHGGVPLGYIPRLLSSSVRELLDFGPASATVARIGEPGTPPHLRLVLDLDVPTPPGFTWDRNHQWEPINA